MKIYNVLDIARYIINYSHDIGHPITNLKLQKLLYLVQANFLLYSGGEQPAFNAEIEAWDYGPVVPQAYNEFRIYVSNAIPRIQEYINNQLQDKTFELDIINEVDRKKINEIVDYYKGYSAVNLVDITHKQDPWKKNYKKYMNNVISCKDIYNYFAY